MCSESEACNRQDHMELSPFECIPGSLKKDVGIISTITSSNKNASNEKSNKWGTTMQLTPQKATRHCSIHNPQYVIKKYRRSAAGGGHYRKPPTIVRERWISWMPLWIVCWDVFVCIKCCLCPIIIQKTTATSTGSEGFGNPRREFERAAPYQQQQQQHHVLLQRRRRR